MAGPCRLRPASSADLAALAELERGAFADPWTPAQLTEAMGWLGALALVAEDDDGDVVGHLIGRVVVDEAEILTVAVSQGARRRGVGRALLDEAMRRMAAKGARTIWLEVRPSNAAALALYGVLGFRAAGRRREYYREPVEDALVLRRDLA